MECKDGVCYLKPKGGAEQLQLAEFGRGSDGSVTLEWRPRDAGAKYQVDVREEGAEEWRTLSDKVATPFLRKKTLKTKASFRVRAANADGSWGPFSDPVELEPNPEGSVMAAPTAGTPTGQDDGKFAVMISWPALAGAERFAVDMRAAQSADSFAWKQLSDSLKGNSVRKKNLDAGEYVFRYRVYKDGAWSQVSAPSATVVTVPTHDSFMQLLGGPQATLLRGKERVPASAALAGKIVLFYFSAGWCGPCRQQTGMMMPWYNQAKAEGLPVEVVLISADRDAGGFTQYYEGTPMPWLALPFQASEREQLMGRFQVSGIPKLTVFAPNGAMLSDNAAGSPLSSATVRSWMSRCGM
ncbi:Thiol-disulfide oxidoreductase resA [Hondaea fermentalgiana]|uniref:protein-disulfide reductase n=1 Tax=Hondaea fermentalgiana TaxID=2315210 RepID=A0A2R5GKM3_9STRA|nr:Thiol-disulfide oxidoreductase resA [Hondaea fermentalgiana]|eukprot:GBG28424.1 Thiol-disulfide oxidoreductase resA [Hondaea fermentalgiana]